MYRSRKRVYLCKFLRKIAMERARLSSKKNPHAEVIKLKNCKTITVFSVRSFCGYSCVCQYFLTCLPRWSRGALVLPGALAVQLLLAPKHPERSACPRLL